MKRKNTNLTGLNKNDIIEADIDDNGLNGDGVIHYADTTIFVKGAIKGERVRAKIISVNKRICFAIIDTILNQSPHRLKPPCPYFGKCGGCTMQHIDYPYQLEIKRQLLTTTLQKQLTAVLPIEACVPSLKEYGYRNKLSMPVQGIPPKIGFFRVRSHALVEVDNCLLQCFDCERLIEILNGFFRKYNLSGYDESTQNGDVRYVVVRHVGGLTLITLVVNRLINVQLKALNEMLEKNYGKMYALYANLNTKNNNIIFSDLFEFIGGNNQKIRHMNQTTAIHPAAFFQVNEHIASSIYNKTAEIIDSIDGDKANRIIIDAYAGAGLLSLSLANSASRVYSVENNEQAHISAKELKKDNNAKNLECVLSDCATAVPQIAKKENGKNIIAVLDPPRAGADERVLDSLMQASVSHIVYISCNPATLARDLKILSATFDIETIIPYDMFPQTGALETLVHLKRNSTSFH